MNMSKYIYMIIAFGAIAILGFFITTFAFQYLGLLGGIISLVATIFSAFGILAIFAIQHAPIETFYDAVKNQGRPMAKMVIIKDAKSNNVWFQEMGELVMTDKGGFFFYGHPFIKPRRILLINSLTSAEATPQFIVINGIPRFKDRMLYVETNHAVLIKGKPTTYEDLIESIAATDTISRLSDNVRKAVGGNTKFITEKTDKMRMDEFDKGGI